MHTIMFSLNFLTVNEVTSERHWIVWATKLNRHIYIKSALPSKFKFKGMLLWKDFCFCFHRRLETINSFRIICFDSGSNDPGDLTSKIASSQWIRQCNFIDYYNQDLTTILNFLRIPKAHSRNQYRKLQSNSPNIIYTCLFSFKEGWL